MTNHWCNWNIKQDSKNWDPWPREWNDSKMIGFWYIGLEFQVIPKIIANQNDSKMIGFQNNWK